MQYREATLEDVHAMATIRAKDKNEIEHWKLRIEAYMRGTHHPQKALEKRSVFVATNEQEVIGLVAGHLTTRFDCNAELQWIHVKSQYKGTGTAFKLLQIVAQWFIAQHAIHVCVDAGNEEARSFYKKHHAINLNEHWMQWKDISVIIE